MPEVLVRDLSDRALDLLKGQDRARGRSLQAELKHILEQAALAADVEATRELADRIRRELAGAPSAIVPSWLPRTAPDERVRSLPDHAELGSVSLKKVRRGEITADEGRRYLRAGERRAGPVARGSTSPPGRP